MVNNHAEYWKYVIGASAFVGIGSLIIAILVAFIIKRDDEIIIRFLGFAAVFGIPAFVMAARLGMLKIVFQVWGAVLIGIFTIGAGFAVRKMIHERRLLVSILVSTISSLTSGLILYTIGIRENLILFSLGVGIVSFSISLFDV